jgi:hypothetical protein
MMGKDTSRGGRVIRWFERAAGTRSRKNAEAFAPPVRDPDGSGLIRGAKMVMQMKWLRVSIWHHDPDGAIQEANRKKR